MFRKINVLKQSISLAFMFVMMVSSCFITNIRHFFSVYAKNNDDDDDDELYSCVHVFS